jgi:Fungal specific transcription factor domain
MTNDEHGVPHGRAATARRQRGSVACRRCRRLRVKCIHTSTNPPCEACKNAGIEYSSQCSFPKRGEADSDRDWRASIRARKLSSAESTEPPVGGSDQLYSPDFSTIRGTSTSSDRARPISELSKQLQPPTDTEIIDSCQVFVTSYFQLGFIPKATFSERIAKKEVSEFLILCILCLSARFTPSLVAKYGTGQKATEYFTHQALQLVPQKMYSPNLENTQGFFLLSIAEWGNGDKDRSSIHMGIAVRMAAMLRLHREETYDLSRGASRESVINAEMGRRTFWMIQSQDNLHSGYNSPGPFSLEDITALLPCEESDFLFGLRPSERAALRGTPPATANPSLADSPKRSLFATLIQAHSLWGQVARRARVPSKDTSASSPPIASSTDYMRLVQALKYFEDHVPQQQRWSIWSLRVWKDLGFELAYLSVVMMLRLGNIIIRRIYLEDMKACLTDASVDPSVREFWKVAANELFQNVEELYEQIDSTFSIRSRAQAYPAILVLPVYVCGSLALNLWQCPELCPSLSGKAAEMLTQCLHFISELQLAWPMARQWQKGLQQAATPLSGGPSPASTPGYAATPQMRSWSLATGAQTQPSRHMNVHHHSSQQPTELERQTGSYAQFDTEFEIGTLPIDLFDAEVTAFLQGEAHFSFLDM